MAFLEERMAMSGSQLAIHDAGTWDLGEGWYIDGGWYSLTFTTPDGEMVRGGSYVTLASKADDGSSQMQWVVTNGGPVDG